jgi:hypothetical protein
MSFQGAIFIILHLDIHAQPRVRDLPSKRSAQNSIGSSEFRAGMPGWARAAPVNIIVHAHHVQAMPSLAKPVWIGRSYQTGIVPRVLSPPVDVTRQTNAEPSR